MVAKATWITVEPRISLAAYLADEETQFFPPALSWMPGQWVAPAENCEVRCPSEDTSEKG